MDGPAWILKVEDFGPIKSGTVTLAPLTVFVGPNNSGKSYMASLVWMVLRADRTLFMKALPGGPGYDDAAGIAQAIQRGEKTLIDSRDWATILGWFNGLLAGHAPGQISKDLGNPSLRLRSIEAELTNSPRDFPISVQALPSDLDGGRSTIDHLINFGGNRLPSTVPGGEIWPRSEIDLPILRTLAHEFSPQYVSATYVPAARTGLMLTYPILVASLIGSWEAPADERARLVIPAPVREFLVSLQYASPGESDHASVACFLEREILAGKIGRDELGKFYYVQDATGISLPLHATSSMVSELAPFIWLLKSGIRGCLIFEEPEAHLHLSAQRTLARALVRVVNTGTPVLITTHSDTFLQQINILMQLHDHPDRNAMAADLGYEPTDMLDPVRARGYSFNVDGGRTTISELAKSEEGFVEPLMNTEIDELTCEVIRMEQS